jgi:hypothetical protein
MALTSGGVWQWHGGAHGWFGRLEGPEPASQWKSAKGPETFWRIKINLVGPATQRWTHVGSGGRVDVDEGGCVHQQNDKLPFWDF